MRLEQLNVLYHENLCGWNSYYTREPVRLEQLLYLEKLCIWMIGVVRQTCSDRRPRAVYSFVFLLAYAFFIDGINSFSIIIV